MTDKNDQLDERHEKVSAFLIIASILTLGVLIYVLAGMNP